MLSLPRLFIATGNALVLSLKLIRSFVPMWFFPRITHENRTRETLSTIIIIIIIIGHLLGTRRTFLTAYSITTLALRVHNNDLSTRTRTRTSARLIYFENDKFYAQIPNVVVPVYLDVPVSTVQDELVCRNSF